MNTQKKGSAKRQEGVVCLDLGGTYLKAAFFAKGVKISRVFTIPVPEKRNEKAIVTFLSDAAREVIQATPSVDVRGVSAGIPGLVNKRTGTVYKSPHFPQWKNFQLAERLASSVNIPVIIENDANLHGLAEARDGVGQKYSSFIMLTLGTGIGGAVIIDGKLLRGGLGTAGEVGHITVEPEGRPCNCGNRGCMERYASSEGIMIDAEEEGLSQVKEAKDVFVLMSEGNAKARRIVKRFSYYLAAGVGSLINTLAPEAVVIGGGLAKSWVLFKGYFMQELKHRVYPELISKVRIVRSRVGYQAGLKGAYYNAEAEGLLD